MMLLRQQGLHMCVFVLDVHLKPLMPCIGARARKLLRRRRACIYRRQPFTIILLDRLQSQCQLQPLELKIDPGSRQTGLCLARLHGRTVHVVALKELVHRGLYIRDALVSRRQLRSGRRSRHTRYRQARFSNRTRPKGWLPPSLRHRVDSVMSWVAKLRRYAPIAALAVERVKFDMQRLQQADIAGVEYQRGELYQYEVRKYLLERHHRSCIYCDIQHVPLEIEHIVPRSRGGSNRISNLGLACRRCNQSKGSLLLEQYLQHDPKRLAKIRLQLRTPLHDAAAVNATRDYLFDQLLRTGLPVMTGTGSQTKYNRTRLGIPKTHALDAACVGDIDAVVIRDWHHQIIHCTGRGRYQRTLPDRYGFPRLQLTRVKRHYGFATGDIVRYQQNNHRCRSSATGRVTVRANGGFIVSTGIKGQVPLNVSHRYCRLLHMADGYRYQHGRYTFDCAPDGHIVVYDFN